MTTPTEPEAASGAPARRSPRRHWTPRTSIQSKILVMLLVVSIVSAAVVGFIGYQSGRSSLSAAVFEGLTEIRGAQTRQLNAQFRDLKNSLVVYTRGVTTVEAIDAFTAGYDELRDARISPEDHRSIVDYYESQFGGDNGDTQADVETLLPKSNAQRYLQAHYTAPFSDWDEAIKNDDAGDGSAWSAANARYNSFFRELVNRFSFEDALLLDTRGNVVYSAYKGADLGTNILTGPYRENELRDVYREALASNALDYVGVTDFGIYQPVEEPTAWMVSPAGADGRVAGVLALQLPISQINRLMTVNKHWKAAGMGDTGETFLVGPDDLMRSDSRLFLEDPDQYKHEVVEAGTPPAVADEALSRGGTTLVQPLSSEAIELAQRGQTGTLIDEDYLGRRTLQAYAPLDLPGLHWSIVAKIDTNEAFAPVSSFTRTLVLSTVGIIFVVCLASMVLARFFVRPIRQLEGGAQRISAGDYHVNLAVTSHDEFGELTAAFNDMSRNLAIKDELLTEQREENDRLLLSLMPEPVMQRYREGEETIAQDHQDVTVIFADIVGLDALSFELPSEESLSIVNDLVRQFDASAEDLGVERVRTMHNGYLASCGLTVPRLDNVGRTVQFATEMQRIIDRFNKESGRKLELRAGIDTGTVTSGLVDRASLAYDMWGAAVNVAYRVQSGSPRPGIYVTARVHDIMRDSYQFTEVGDTDASDGAEPIWRLSGERP